MATIHEQWDVVNNTSTSQSHNGCDHEEETDQAETSQYSSIQRAYGNVRLEGGSNAILGDSIVHNHIQHHYHFHDSPIIPRTIVPEVCLQVLVMCALMQAMVNSYADHQEVAV